MPNPGFWDNPTEWWAKSSRREKGLSFLLLSVLSAIVILVISYLADALSFEHLLVAGAALAGVELAVGIYVGLLELEDLERLDEMEIEKEILGELKGIRRLLQDEPKATGPVHEEPPPPLRDK